MANRFRPKPPPEPDAGIVGSEFRYKRPGQDLRETEGQASGQDAHQPHARRHAPGEGPQDG